MNCGFAATALDERFELYKTSAEHEGNAVRSDLGLINAASIRNGHIVGTCDLRVAAGVCCTKPTNTLVSGILLTRTRFLGPHP